MDTEKWKKNIKKIKDYLDNLEKKGLENDTLEWRGFGILDKIFNLYLYNKYKTSCLAFTKRRNKKESSYHGLPIVNEYTTLTFYINNDKYLKWENYNTSKMAKVMADCINHKKELIIITLSIYTTKKDGIEKGHSNILIYRPKTNSIEHFEPHGARYCGGDDGYALQIKEKIEDFVKQINNELKKYKLQEVTLITSEICFPYGEGLQSLE